MMDEAHSTLQQLAIWKDKYHRLSEQYGTLLNQNQELEDRLLNVVDKIERDKSLLSDEIDHLAEKLACATNTIDYMKNECARYKSDCMLAVHLLQCQPSFYSSQHLNSLPAELRQKLSSDASLSDGSSIGSRTGINEKKVVQLAMTFPPTAVFLQSNEPSVDEIPPEEPGSRHDVRDVFLKKIRMAPDYQTEKLVQCPKCGFAVVKYDRCTQTIGDSYLSNSRSAPHLYALDDEHEPGLPNARRKRRSTTTTSGGDLLIDLSDEERTSTPTSPMYPVEGTTNPLAVSHQPQVRFNLSPGVHQHRYPNADSTSDHHHTDSFVQQKSTVGAAAGTRYEQPRHSEFTSIPISEDG